MSLTSRIVIQDQGASSFVFSSPAKVRGTASDLVIEIGAVTNCTFNTDENTTECVQEQDYPEYTVDASGSLTKTAISASTSTYGRVLIAYATISVTNLGSKVSIGWTSLAATMLIVPMGALMI